MKKEKSINKKWKNKYTHCQKCGCDISIPENIEINKCPICGKKI